MLDSPAIERETIPSGLRKRRMDWDPIELNASNSNGGVGPTESKLSNMTNVKDRERRKTATSSNNGKNSFLVFYYFYYCYLKLEFQTYRS